MSPVEASKTNKLLLLTGSPLAVSVSVQLNDQLIVALIMFKIKKCRFYHDVAVFILSAPSLRTWSLILGWSHSLTHSFQWENIH